MTLLGEGVVQLAKPLNAKSVSEELWLCREPADLTIQVVVDVMAQYLNFSNLVTVNFRIYGALRTSFIKSQ